MRVAVFVSPHGFGHAARASAVMEALSRIRPVRFEIFTTVPRAFFDELLNAPFGYHSVETDVGFRQLSAFRFDLPGTVAALNAFRDGVDGLAEEVALRVRELGCTLVHSDISPLGVLVAERLGIPSVLVENFTWDWIYELLLQEAPGLVAHRAWFSQVYGRATLRYQPAPACNPLAGAHETNPVARRPRKEREEVRRMLGIGMEEPVSLLTTGGIPQELPFLDELGDQEGHFLITGSRERGRRGNLHFFHRLEPVHSPDLIAASDRVVAKLGYSTVAEVWLQDRPLLFVANDRFREIPVLRHFVKEELRAEELSVEAFLKGDWIEKGLSMPLERSGSTGDGTERRSGSGQIASAMAEVMG